MNVLLGSTIAIPSSVYDTTKIKEALTYDIPPRHRNDPGDIIFNYFTRGEYLHIPFGRKDLIPEGATIVDKTCSYYLEDFPDFSDEFTLRESQSEIASRSPGSYVINAPPAFGKTFTTLALLANWKQKALIIVHTRFLRDQWIEEARKCLGFTPSVIGGGKFDYDKAVTVATIQTLKKHAVSLRSKFGVVVVDETHRAHADIFQSALNKLAPRYRVGVTATLNRKDRREFLVTDAISRDIIKVDSRENSMPLKAYFFPLGHKFELGKGWAHSVNKLYDDEEFNIGVIMAAKALLDKGHKVLVLGDRVEALTRWNDELKYYNYKSELVVGNTTDEIRQAAIENVNNGTYDIIVGAIKIFSEGVSINSLSGLVLAHPINNKYLLEQVINRITRLREGKLNPVVIDFKLGGSLGYSQFKQRLKDYKALGASPKVLTWSVYEE